ncbi:virulence plasmid A protein [Nitrosospira sp. Nsp18]|uniref:Tc toxin subunit A-related protein n=1 Tax=Nitrosospira sp. Nsp18 TaxID=1855334 RepID=UPI00088C5A42|nr:neuraminidase-like domain-containing protein [Nitrosospira sp. Nsp18]SDA19785.1 virulence plasmid A protein [Nitrosospira sp. Nsp18]
MTSDTAQIADSSLASFYKADPGFDVRQVDFHNPDELSQLQAKLGAAGITEDNMAGKVAELKTYQRLLNLHPDPDVAQGLMGRGIISANHLARIPLKSFVAEHGGPLGLDAQAAENLHQRAMGVRNSSMHLWASVNGAVASSYFRNSRMDTVSAQLKQTFQNLPSYQDMFGSLDYCGCPECRSIFGPAAYLVDLLRIIDQYVTTPNTGTIDPQFLFTTRRPDIWQIELTCANANTPVPYLQIVNERLIARAAQVTGADVLEQVATTLVYPQALPFNAPLDQIRVLLDKVGVSYGQILSAWKAAPSTVSAQSLGLSPDQQQIITTELTTNAQVAPYYNVSDISTLNVADTFMAKTWMSFVDMLTLLNQDLSDSEQQAGLQVNFFINQGLAGKWVALTQQKDQPALLSNLGVKSLDQINRFQRLVAVVGQPAVDIDWALRCVQAGATPIISNDALTSLQLLIAAGSKLGLDLPTSSVLLGPIKTYGQGVNAAGSAFDQLFNSTAIVANNAPYHPSGNPLNPGYTDTPLPWTPGSQLTADINAINRVLPGLGIGLADVNALGLFLVGVNKPQQLTVQTISVLYRHVLLSRSLQLPMSRYLLLLKLAAVKTPATPTVLEINSLTDKGQWLTQIGLSLYQLDYIVNGIPSVYVNPLYQPDNVEAWQQGLWVIVPLSSPTAASDIQAQVAVLFGADNTVVNAAMSMALAAVTLPAGVTDWTVAFLTPDSDGKTPKYGDYVQAVLKWVSRWLIMAQSLGLADAILANVAAYPEAYQLTTAFDSLSWDAIQSIWQVQQMMQDYGDLQQNLLSYIRLASIGAPPADSLLVLQKATGWEPSVVEELLSGPLGNVIVVSLRLANLQTCINLMRSLGANPGFMDSVVALADLQALNNWPTYNQTAAAVMARVASVYGPKWDEIWSLLSGNLAVHLRDALLALVLSQLNTDDAPIKNARNVYEFLLTDVEMGPTTTISYIVEALNASQLYLQRCRLQLEPGVVDMTQVQDVWWEWMMNYRVWEANREIFVYPENYLIPSLRKNTTPQFAALSQTLQQSDVTKAYVSSAFATYVNGFSEVAQLKPVDAYRTRINDTDTIYLLSRTKTGPYTFYYCSQPAGMPWTPWEKIDLSIDSPNCTLVYAFSRPFLFWNEVKKNNTSAVSGNDGTVTTSNSVTYTVSVMYSFLNQKGEWVQPQTLVDQDVVLFQSDDSRKITLKDQAIFDGLFDIGAASWNKVFAFNVNAQNYVTPPSFKAEAERLVVMYGPNVLDTGAVMNAETSPPTTDPNAGSFWASLHRRAEDHNRMVIGQLSGNVKLRPVSVLNLSLESDVLVQRQEFLLADPYLQQTPLSLIRAEMQSSGDIMQISQSGQPITDNSNAGGTVGLTSGSKATSVNGYSFISTGISSAQSLQIYQSLLAANVIDAKGNVLSAAMATLDLYSGLSAMTVYNQFGPLQYSAALQVLLDHMDATELFSSVGGSSTKIVPVGTQPGWFLFFVQDEIFLLSPKEDSKGVQSFSTFAEGLTVGDPRIEPTFAIMQYQGTTPGSIEASVSAQIFAILTQFNLVQNGRLAPNVTVAYLQAILLNLGLTAAQFQYLLNALRNSPIIFDDAFVSDKISYADSQLIYAALQTLPPLVDPNGRIDEEHLTGANVQLCLGNLLLLKTISQSQIAGIYRILAQAPKAIALTYTNRGSAANFTSTGDFHFDVTRLSTGAVSKISRALFVNGVDSLLNLKTQEIPVVPVLPFDRFTPSKSNLNWPSALDATQVDFDGLYGQYFWEIFYHTPMLVAYSLNTNQQFQEAQIWLQYVFNPTVPEQYVAADTIFNETGQAISMQQAGTIVTQLQKNPPLPAVSILSGAGEVNPDFTASTDLSFLQTADPTLTNDQVLMVRNILLNYQLSAPSSHFWKFRPFRNHTLQTLKDMLSDDNPAVKVYNDDPFDPFAIARLRIGAFEKSTLMQYIDNLLAWGDQLFTQDSWESITGAYMLYVYAYDLLGPKPEKVGDCPGSGIVLDFAQIKAKYPDGIPQFLIDLEHFIPGGSGSDNPMMGHAFNDLYDYFCVPENSNLMSRWDTVQDRMYKINNSMNIEGVTRSLALFQPPINPLDLIKASLAGNNVLAGASSKPQLSPYRFGPAISAAKNLCSILIELGNSLLSTLEKNDAEALAALRTNQEGQILEMTTQIRLDRIAELQATLQSQSAALSGANNRLKFYTDLINNGLSNYEQTSLSASEAALTANILGSISKTAATIAYAVPQVGSPFAMTYGGIQIGSAVNAASGVFEIGAEISNYIAQRASTMGGYDRRSQDWGLQKQLAQADTNSLTQQIVATNLQLQSAQQDLAVQKKTIDQNKAIEGYLKGKFTNQDLYQWMMGRLSAVYFQTYSLALQVARQAEAAYQFESDSDQTFLSFDYWDSLHKGLTAGEGLRLALNRMDASFQTGDKRRLEVEKTISLAMIAPDQLLTLKTTGACSFSLTEALFDYDYPGQYSRKVKTVSVSIPAVVGPYQNIKAILTQTKNSVATDGTIEAVKYLLAPSGDMPKGVRQNWAQNQSIAISRGLDDSGLFTLDFQDQRYLPFENTGAVSDWTLSMPLDTNRFDFEQLSDVIITLRYSALFDGNLETQVKTALGQTPLTGGVYVDGSMQSSAWQTFLVDHSDGSNQTLTLNVNPAQLGYFKSLTYSKIILQLTVAAGIKIQDGASFLSLSACTVTAPAFTITGGQAVIDAPEWNGKTLSAAWKLQFNLQDTSLGPLLSGGFIDGKKLLDLQVVALYDAKVF